jgi:glycosyltransferase involved in cell wall biosynthesis
MKVLILGGSNSRNSGGVFDTARVMGQRLHENNRLEVEYLMHDDEYSEEDKKQYSPLPVHSYKVKGSKRVGYSPDIYKKIEAINPDIVHTQSLWMYLSYANKKYNQKTGTPYIVSPHGMLDRWQLKQSFWKDLKKNIVLRLYEQKHLEHANCIHALCQEEHDAIRALGLKNPIAIIPNGMELPINGNGPGNGQHTVKTKSNERRKLLFLARIHQKKGIDNLLEAWSLLKPNQHNWELVIAGETKDTDYMQQLLSKRKRLEIETTASFVGGQFGPAKQSILKESDAYILPSFSEGLPMSVLEAWSYNLPALTTPYCNLPEGYVEGAAIKIDTSSESIAEGIRQLMALPDNERKTMGSKGYELVKNRFSWTRVANEMTELYNWVSGKNGKPDFVYV